MELAVPADPELPAAWPTCAVLLPHARAVLDLTNSGIRRIADFLGSSGPYPAAPDLYRLIADAHTGSDARGPDHPDTLTTRRSLARRTGEAENTADARDQYAALLPLYELVPRPEHSYPAIARSQLAYWTGKAERLSRWRARK